MTLDEFKAWLEGYEHSFGSMTGQHPYVSGCVTAGYAPSVIQWQAIKDKLASVGGQAGIAQYPSPRTVYTGVAGGDPYPSTLVAGGAGTYSKAG